MRQDWRTAGGRNTEGVDSRDLTQEPQDERSAKGKRCIGKLFTAYIKEPTQLPNSTRRKLREDNAYRVICDYIAGMTDRYALDEHKRLFDPHERT